MKITWMIGGAQGTGVDTSATLFGNAVAAAGYYLYGNREYYSNIKGRHSYFNVTISDRRVHSISQHVDILASFDAETVFQHFTEVKSILIYNKELENIKISTIQSMEPELVEYYTKLLNEQGFGETIGDVVKSLQAKGIKVIPVNYDEVLKKIAGDLKVPLSVVERARNMIAVGVSFKLLGLKSDYLFNSIRKTFKNELFAKMNILASQYGMDLVQPIYNLQDLEANIKGKKRIQVDGNTSVAMGKIYGGLRFQSYYPITPASDESVFIEAHEEVFVQDPETGEKYKQTIVVVQAEDELAAINMASGAALTGVRAATATSGPGFSLMTEGIGWAGMNEVPVVITYYIRGGPATGQPTRTSQADLLFAMNVSHGEFPRIVIASGDHVEAFQDSVWALNLAEKYQTPVIHLVDKALANSYSIFDVDELGLKDLVIDRGKLVLTPPPDYKRFAITPDGVSPRAPLGTVRMFYTGDEHNEEGHIREASFIRETMYEKRIKKLETVDREVPEEQRIRTYGDLDSKNIIITWGSPKGVIMDVIDELAEEGIKLGMIQVKMFNPYPVKMMTKLLSGKERIIDVESNYFGQAGEVLKWKTGISPTNYILKWNGRPVMRDELKDAIKLILEKDEKRVVLHGGA
ncbi:MAG: 2-oxoacid:ferredoxin oxidoreductase subunit alpha [Sulfolobaceae archaeon]|nr:2-oxoacid:ferredoxin oxidoreductase subunit alpha [Sulfolobaceae archaeon]